ncbi:MAG: hypothetical protein ACOX7P_09680 [Oscillospiraceae bacterium]|jgi:hypothetical protein
MDRDENRISQASPYTDNEFTVDEILEEYYREELKSRYSDVPATEKELERTIGDIVTSVLKEDERRRTVVRKSRPKDIGTAKTENKPKTETKTESKTEQGKIVYLNSRRGGTDEKAKKQKTGRPARKKREEKPITAQTAERAMRRARARASSAGTRAKLSAVVCAASIYLTIAPGFKLPCPPETTVILILCALLVLAALLCADAAARGVRALLRLRPNYESLADILAILVLFDGIAAFFTESESVRIPFSCVATIAFTISLAGLRDRNEALAVSLKSFLAVSKPTAVTSKPDSYRHNAVIARGEMPADSFTAAVSQPDRTERLMKYVVYFSVAATLILAFTVVAAGVGGATFIHIWSGLLAVSSPFAYAVAFVSPLRRLSKRIARAGAAIAGGEGARRIARSRYILLTDRDIFPDGSVTLNGLKIYGNFDIRRIVGYTNAILSSVESCWARPFAVLSREQLCPSHHVTDLKTYKGGISAYIGGDHILCGDGEFMLRNRIRLPDSIKYENKLFTAVNSEIAGAFALTYAAAVPVSTSLDSLISSGYVLAFVSPVFSFTNKLLVSVFGLRESGFLIPSPEEAEELMKTDISGYAWAITNREGIMPFEEAALGSKRLVRAARINMLFAALGALLGLAIMSFLMFIGEFTAASACNASLFMLCWLVPVLFFSGNTDKF